MLWATQLDLFFPYALSETRLRDSVCEVTNYSRKLSFAHADILIINTEGSDIGILHTFLETPDFAPACIQFKWAENDHAN